MLVYLCNTKESKISKIRIKNETEDKNKNSRILTSLLVIFDLLLRT